MIRNIYVFSRDVIETMLKTKETISTLSWALISIYSSPKEQLITDDQKSSIRNMNCKHVLNLCFGDIGINEFERLKDTRKDLIDNGLRLFDETDAQKILDFMKKVNNDPIGTLVVHCDAGISRSGAVSIFLCRYLGLDEDKFRKTNKHIHPNDYVYGVLSKVSGMKNEYEKYWERTFGTFTENIKFDS